MVRTIGLHNILEGSVEFHIFCEDGTGNPINSEGGGTEPYVPTDGRLGNASDPVAIYCVEGGVHQIAGDFNDWIPDGGVVTPKLEDHWQKVLHVPEGAYEYRVIIDGIWQQDPTNPYEVPNNLGGNNSLLRV